MGFFKSSSDLAIDLGTATVLVYVKGKGIVLKEPSVVAINRVDGKVLAVGEEARKMIGRTPGNIVAVKPMSDGVISDYDVTEKMLKALIGKACSSKAIGAPKVVICIPSMTTEIEKRAVIEAARNSGAKDVQLIEEPLAAAIGAGIDITKPNGYMIVDIGGGTCDIAVISLGGVVVRTSVKSAGNKFDEAISKYIRNKYNMMIGEKTAEEIKISIGSAYKTASETISIVKGRSLLTGLPDNIKLTSQEIREALREPVSAIIRGVKDVLEHTPPELAADIIDNGIIMTGGGSLLTGLDKLIETVTGVSVYVVDNAVEAVAEGTGAVLGYLDKLDLSTNAEEIVLISET